MGVPLLSHLIALPENWSKNDFANLRLHRNLHTKGLETIEQRETCEPFSLQWLSAATIATKAGYHLQWNGCLYNYLCEMIDCITICYKMLVYVIIYYRMVACEILYHEMVAQSHDVSSFIIEWL